MKPNKNQLKRAKYFNICRAILKFLYVWWEDCQWILRIQIQHVNIFKQMIKENPLKFMNSLQNGPNYSLLKILTKLTIKISKNLRSLKGISFVPLFLRSWSRGKIGLLINLGKRIRCLEEIMILRLRMWSSWLRKFRLLNKWKLKFKMRRRKSNNWKIRNKVLFNRFPLILKRYSNYNRIFFQFRVIYKL